MAGRFWLALALVGGTGTAIAQEPIVLAGETLREAVAGKTVYLATLAGELPISYRPNGTMSARSGALAQFVGSESDSGTWWITRDRLCQKWSTWLDGRAFCYTLRRNGETVHWTRNDGRTGTATIAR